MTGIQDCVIYGQQAQDFAARAEQQLAECQAAPAPAPVAGGSCAGSVPLDIDGNAVVDQRDAITLFVALTLRGFGARELLESYRAAHPHAPAPVTSVDAILATVLTARA